MAKIIIVVRAKNEQRWLRFFFERLMIQTEKSFEVVIVDNNSNDLSLDIARSYGATIVNINEYNPSAAINIGFQSAASRKSAEYGVIISAHCIPTNELWLENLINPMLNDDQIVGCYGSQVPMKFSNADNTRDLMFTFGHESHYVKDNIFFHNANSALRLSYYWDFPFDESVNHIEDLVWAHEVVSNKKDLFYTASAKVWHAHGLHQHKSLSFRSKTVMQTHIGITGFKYPEEDIFNFKNLNIAFVIDTDEGSLNDYQKEIDSIGAFGTLLSKKNIAQDDNANSNGDLFARIKSSLDLLRIENNIFFDVVFFYSDKYKSLCKNELISRLNNFFLQLSDGLIVVEKLEHGICKKVSPLEAEFVSKEALQEDIYISNVGNLSIFWSDVFENKTINEISFTPCLLNSDQL